MTTFDDLQLRRPALAKSYLALLDAQPGRPLAMFAPRRVGKTYFLDHDLAPAATRDNRLPVYADLWNHKTHPLEAINHALEEALDDLDVPTSRLGRLGKTRVRKIGLIGASVDLGDAPARRALPSAPQLRLDALVVRLAQTAKRTVLLMLDEPRAWPKQKAAMALSPHCARCFTNGATSSNPSSPGPRRKGWHECCRPPARRCTSSPNYWTFRRSATSTSNSWHSTSHAFIPARYWQSKT